MGSNFWSRCSLGAKLDKCLGRQQVPLDDVTIDDNQALEDARKWQRGSRNFNRLERLVNSEEEHVQWKDFRESLGSQQLASWTAITEWITGSYQPPHLSAAARAAIDAGEPEQRRDHSVHPEFPASALINESIYHYELSELYAMEFLESALEKEHPDIFLGMLEHRRRLSLDHAACQQIAHTYYISHDEESHEPSTNWQIGRLHSRKEVCPWLADISGHDGNPHYLWDITGRRTVVFEEISSTMRPEYTCISHTWGRWRTNDTVTLDGVTWKIPQNTIFQVRDLPEYLTTLHDQITTDYVWFDLLCIPQVEDGMLATLARREISRQAIIFKGAAACIAWLNYVNSWNAERHTIKWLSLTYLRLSSAPGLYGVEGLLGSAKAAAEEPLQLTMNPLQNKFLGPKEFPLSGPLRDFRKPERWLKPSAWFSSLWTLQEAYFCPHMVMMSRSWDALSNSAGILVTLETLFALITRVMSLLKVDIPGVQRTPGHQIELVTEEYQYLPQGPGQLGTLILDLFLVDGGNPSRTHILIQGNTRQCTERRAEAIMAVLGVTDWFDPAEVQQGKLVLGMYPLVFVEEAARKIGPNFFLARKRIGSPWKSLGYFFGSARGSMLPFNALNPILLKGQGELNMHPFHAYNEAWHPAASTWTFTESGSVRIRQAAILGERNAMCCKALVQVQVLLSYQAVPGKIVNEVPIDLQQWLLGQPKHLCTYAVNISKTLGLILQGFAYRLSTETRLIKTGCYEVWGRDDDESSAAPDWLESQRINWVPTRAVNWIVL